jgi:hypothetical protein
LPRKRKVKPISVASACVRSVAIAAPATPIAGTGPQPKLNYYRLEAGRFEDFVSYGLKSFAHEGVI